jgi:hypothetical protein
MRQLRPDLPLADPADLAEALAYALRFDGKARKRSADDMMANIVAERLVRHLEKSGFVVLKAEAAVGHGALARGAGSSSSSA